MNRKNHTPDSAVGLFLKTLAEPAGPEGDVEQSAERLLADLERQYRHGLSARNVEPLAASHSPSRHSWPVFAAAALLLAASLLLLLFRNAEPAVATIETGVFTSVAPGASATLGTGGGIRPEQWIQAGAARGGLLALSDGSRVELSPRTQISIVRQKDGMELRLAAGNVIVSAAKQRDSHLYVRTKDCLVSVKGTVFVVGAEEAGSRISVLEGVVVVRQNENTQTVSGGQQVVTNPSMEVGPIVREILWSNNAALRSLIFDEPPAPDALSTGPVVPGSVDGIVVHTTTGSPLADVALFLQGVAGNSYYPLATQAAATTGKDGRFSIGNVPPGAYVLIASRSGFWMPDAPVRSAGLPSGVQLKVSNGQALKDLRIPMIPSSSIAGHLIDERGKPLRSVVLRLFRLEYGLDGRPSLQLANAGTGETRTDEQGAFEFSDIYPADYYIKSLPDPAHPVPFYYPGVPSADLAAAVTVRPGNVVAGINLSAPNIQVYSVRFKLPPGSPSIPPGSIDLHRAGNLLDQENLSPAFEVRAISGEEYAISRVPPGQYQLRMSWTSNPKVGANGSMSSSVTLVGVDFEVHNKNLDLGRVPVPLRSSIPVHMTFADGVKSPVLVMASAPSSGASVVAVEGDAVPDRLVLSSLLRLKHGLDFKLTPGHYVLSAQYGGRDALSEGLVVDGADRGALEVVVDRPAGSLEGFVRNAKGDLVADANAVLIPLPYRRVNPYFFRITQTDQSGAFRFKDVPPGDYRVYSWESLPSNAFRNEDWFREYESRGNAVTVRRGATATVNVRLIPQLK